MHFLHSENKLSPCGFFAPKRLVYNGEKPGENSSEKSKPGAGDTVDERKLQAYKEIQEIYDLGEYNTYNFRKLPKEFKDNMENNFKQWVDGNISKYDKDKNSGIDANEYKTFKDDLTNKVKGILDRLAQIKKARTEQAKATAEQANEAKERQQLLEKGRKAAAEGKPLDDMEGLYFSLLEYQEDFKKEAETFGKLSATFGNAKESMDNANKAHNTGLVAVGEYLVGLAPWADDSPEVAAAKKAKDEAIKDFQTKLSEMKKRQKERQDRGKKLNGGPEALKAKTQKKYEGYRKDVTTKQDEIQKRKEDNEARKKQMQQAREDAMKVKDQVASKKDDQEGEARVLKERKDEFDKNAEDVGTYENAVVQAIAKLQEVINQTPEPQKQELIEKLQKLTESQEKAVKSKEQITVAGQVTDQQIVTLEGGQNGAVLQLGSLNVKLGKVDDVMKLCDSTALGLDDAGKKLDQQLIDLDKEETDQIAHIDDIDAAIADTVLEVDTANFEIINQGETYLKSLYGMEAKGPGLIDTIGATFKGIPGVEAGSNWIGQKSSDFWNWCKKAPVLGDTIQIVGYMGEGWSKGVEAIGGALSWVGDKLHLGEAWDWMSEASKHLTIGNPTGNPAIDAILDTFSGGGLGAIVEMFAGVTEGCKDLVKGVGIMVAHPLDAAKGILQLVNHPSLLTDAFLQKDKWHEESGPKIIGRMCVDVVLTLSGGGAATQGIKAGYAGFKLGGLTLREAAMVGVKTFGRVFIEDMAKLVTNTIKLPGNLAKGVGRLAEGIASGGKTIAKLSGEGKLLTTALEATRTSVGELFASTGPEQKASKNLAKAQTALLDPEKMAAYKKLQEVKGNPEGFKKLLQENPRVIDMAGDYEKAMGKHKDAAAKYEGELIKNPEYNAENKAAWEQTKKAKADPDPNVYKKFAAEHPDVVEKAQKYGKIDDAIEAVGKREKLQTEMAKHADAYADLRKIVAEADGDAEKIRTKILERKARDPEWYNRVKQYEHLEREYVLLGESFEPTRGNPLYPLTLTERIALNEMSTKIMGDIDVFKKAETEKMTEGLTPAERELWEHANLDPMTGMYNRNGYLQAEKWVGEGKKITQASIDGDYFSAFNFVKGSEFGDQIIRTMGAEFQKTVAELRKKYPDSNVMAIRKGGEEFVVIGTDIPESAMASAMNDLRARMRGEVQKVCADIDPSLLSTKGNPGKLEDFLDKKGKYKSNPNEPLQVGDSTMGVKGFGAIDIKGPPPRDPKQMVEAMDTITDELMEHNKLESGRGKVYVDGEGRVYTAADLEAHMPKSGLDGTQAGNVQNIMKPLVDSAEARFTSLGRRPQGKKLMDKLDGVPAENDAAKAARRKAVTDIILDPEFSVPKIRQRCAALNLPEDVIQSILATKSEHLNVLQTTDRLTGIYSKPGISAEIEAAHMAGRHPSLYEVEPCAKFKPVNEVGGHLGGDAYMVYVANAVENFCNARGLKVGRSGVNFLVMGSDGPISGTVLSQLRSTITKANEDFFAKVDAGSTGAPMRQLVDAYIDANLPAEAKIIKPTFYQPKLSEIPTAPAGRPALLFGPDGKPIVAPKSKDGSKVSAAVDEAHPVPTVLIPVYRKMSVDARKVEASIRQTQSELGAEGDAY